MRNMQEGLWLVFSILLIIGIKLLFNIIMNGSKRRKLGEKMLKKIREKGTLLYFNLSEDQHIILVCRKTDLKMARKDPHGGQIVVGNSLIFYMSKEYIPQEMLLQDIALEEDLRFFVRQLIEDISGVNTRLVNTEDYDEAVEIIMIMKADLFVPRPYHPHRYSLRSEAREVILSLSLSPT